MRSIRGKKINKDELEYLLDNYQEFGFTSKYDINTDLDAFKNTYDLPNISYENIKPYKKDIECFCMIFECDNCHNALVCECKCNYYTRDKVETTRAYLTYAIEIKKKEVSNYLLELFDKDIYSIINKYIVKETLPQSYQLHLHPLIDNPYEKYGKMITYKQEGDYVNCFSYDIDNKKWYETEWSMRQVFVGYEYIKLSDSIKFDVITNGEDLVNLIIYGFYNE